MRENPKICNFFKKRTYILQYLSFKNSLNIPFSIRLKLGWRSVLEESFKKNKNTEKEIETNNPANRYDFKPLTMRYITIHRVFVGHFSV